MANVYDLVLNFNKEYYAFYEWMSNDNIIHIKKILLLKTDSETFNDFIMNNVVLDKDFLTSIYNKCEYFTKNGLKNLPYAFLVSDSYRVMGIILDANGKITKYSSLLLDEEEDVLEIAFKLPIVKLSYQKGVLKEDNLLTREERIIQNYLKKDIEGSSKDKLRYLYYEYYGKNPSNLHISKQELLDELMYHFNDKHIELYNLLKVPLRQNNV